MSLMTPIPKISEINMHRLFVLLALTVSLGVSACNTMSGVGKDVGAAGDAVTRSAEEAKN